MSRSIQQLFDLRGKTALITGGSRGLGLQLARALGEAGATLMLSSRKAQDLEQAAADLKADGIDARWIAATAQDPAVVSLADAKLSIVLTKAAIRQSELLVTTDSGPRHFAAPFGRPVITLFGPTHIAWSETYFGRGEHLQLKLDCGPCQQRECPQKHHRCMRDLSVDTVFEAVERHVNKRWRLRIVA